MMLKPIMHLIRNTSIIFLGLGCQSVFAVQTPHPDEKEPVKIDSDFATFNDKKGTATYTGHVIMIQGSRHLTSETLVILRDPEGKIESMVATGNPAHFQAKSDPEKPIANGEAKTIQYFPKQDKLLLLEDAILTQQEKTIQGNSLVYHPSTRVLTSEPIPGQQTTIILGP